jgi:hypothetical protein
MSTEPPSYNISLPTPASYKNWRAYRERHSLRGRAEIPIYSDIEFSLPPADGLGPYRLGADPLRQRKVDQFRELGFGAAIRIERERVASAV